MKRKMNVLPPPENSLETVGLIQSRLGCGDKGIRVWVKTWRPEFADRPPFVDNLQYPKKGICALLTKTPEVIVTSVECRFPPSTSAPRSPSL